MCVCLPSCMSVHVCTWYLWSPGQEKVLDSLDRSYGWLWATMWILGTKPRSSARAACALSCWAISPAPLSVLTTTVYHKVISVCCFCLHNTGFGERLQSVEYIRLASMRTQVASRRPCKNWIQWFTIVIPQVVRSQHLPGHLREPSLHDEIPS